MSFDPDVPHRPYRAVVYVHEEMEGPHRLEAALRRAGFTLELRRGVVEAGDEDADLVVVMGGFMSVYDADLHPVLKEELRVLEQRLETGRPNLGICLGAQLLAAASGSKVYAGKPGMVLGVLPVTLTPEGLSDPLFAGFEERFEVTHWHQDTFDPIHGAVLLASTARYPWEMFRIQNSYGVQFHPELDEATFESWVRSSPEDLEKAGRTVEDVLTRDLPRLQAAQHPTMLLMERLAQFFAREVGARAHERYLFTVSSSFRLEGRGVVLAPGIPRRTPIIRVGQKLFLMRPDGSRVDATVRGLAAFTPQAAEIPVLVELEQGDDAVEIPQGTEALTTAPLDLITSL